jgi:hypothetical protein
MTRTGSRGGSLPGDAPRQRLRFEELTHHTEADGRCRIAVRLEWCGRSLGGYASAVETHQGGVRGAAQAALLAAGAAAAGGIDFELVGVKAFRAFDGWVVVVRVIADADGRSTKLLGASSSEDEGGLERASAQAVLDATNRILTRYVGS